MNDDDLPSYPAPHPQRVDRSPGYIGRAFRGVDAELRQADRKQAALLLAVLFAIVAMVITMAVLAAVFTWMHTANPVLTGVVLLGTPVLLVVVAEIGVMALELRRARDSATRRQP